MRHVSEMFFIYFFMLIQVYNISVILRFFLRFKIIGNFSKIFWLIVKVYSTRNALFCWSRKLFYAKWVEVGHSRKLIHKISRFLDLVKLSSRKVSFSKKAFLRLFPAGIYLLKVNNRNTRTRCEICLKLTIKTPKRCHSCIRTEYGDYKIII